MYPDKIQRPVFRLGSPAAPCGVAACGLLDTDPPNIVGSDDLDTPDRGRHQATGGHQHLHLAKDGDFQPVGIPGNTDPSNSNDFSDGYVLLSGILADEFVNPGFIPSRTEIDLRIDSAHHRRTG